MDHLLTLLKENARISLEDAAKQLDATPEEVQAHSFTNADDDTQLIQPNAQPGDVRYLDISGPDGLPDGIIGSDDRTLLGSAMPDFFGGIRNQITYKKFDLSFFFNYSYGNEVVNYNRWILSQVQPGINQLTEVTSRWTPQNTETSVPRASSQRAAEYAIDSRFVEDASFLRLRDVTLTYRVPNQLMEKVGVTSGKLFIRGNNLLTITNYKGLDPEANSFNPAESNLAGIEVSMYPLVRMYTVGLNVQF